MITWFSAVTWYITALLKKLFSLLLCSTQHCMQQYSYMICILWNSTRCKSCHSEHAIYTLNCIEFLCAASHQFHIHLGFYFWKITIVFNIEEAVSSYNNTSSYVLLENQCHVPFFLKFPPVVGMTSCSTRQRKIGLLHIWLS